MYIILVFALIYMEILHGVQDILGYLAWGTRHPGIFCMGYKISQGILHGVQDIPGYFAWGTEYPRKFSTQDAIFIDLHMEGDSEFPEGIPYFLGK